MSNKGFISLYFLIMFLFISTLSLYFINKITTHQMILDNMRKTNRIIDLETLIINEINLQLKFCSMLDTFYIQGIEINVEQDKNILYVTVYDKIPFDLEIMIDNHTNRIYNYETIINSY